MQHGILHAFLAFDWGEAIDLEKARQIEPAEFHVLPRRRRTPSSFTFHPAPLRFGLPDLPLSLPELGDCSAAAVLTVFDFGAVSLDVNIRFQLPADALVRLAGWLADPDRLLAGSRAALRPLFHRLQPVIRTPLWPETMVEEYFVFQFAPNSTIAADWQRDHAGWLANVLHLENHPLSDEEKSEAMRLRLSYSPHDLFLPDWGAAVLLDDHCEETLQAIEFANLQLLELRHIDDRLDAILAQTEKMVALFGQKRLTRWHGPTQDQRILGEMKAEAATLYERSTNALKLVGDTYLARTYRLLAERFRLTTWEAGIQRKLEVIEGIYQVIADQAESARSTTLELIVIALIAVEVVFGFLRH